MNDLRDKVMYDPAFQAACQRYAHGNGSSAAIAASAIRIITAGIANMTATDDELLRVKCAVMEIALGKVDVRSDMRMVPDYERVAVTAARLADCGHIARAALGERQP